MKNLSVLTLFSSSLDHKGLKKYQKSPNWIIRMKRGKIDISNGLFNPISLRGVQKEKIGNPCTFPTFAGR